MQFFDFPLPLEIHSIIRLGYGVLLAVLHLLMIPYGRVYFTSEKYGGCLPSNKFSDLLLTPAGYWVLTLFWISISILIAFGVWSVPLSLVNLALCYTFFIALRWATPMRGMGAPGYISYWLAAYIFFTEYALHHGDAWGRLYNLAVFAFRWDFAVMMLDSGVNKIFHGYPQNKGMNFGMANPAWGYWPNLFKKIRVDHPLFKFCNFSAIFFQVLGALCLFFPRSYALGAVIIAGSFVVVHLLIRLGVLCNMIILSTLIYCVNGDALHHWIQSFYSAEAITSHPIPLLNNIFSILLWAFIILLPLVKLGMYWNFYAKRSLPSLIQKAMEKYTNALGIIIWRVFTIELIDYFIQVYFEDRISGKRTLYTRFGHRQLRGNNRFLWVGESIMSVIVFNSARYFPKTELFQQRVLRYAKTFPVPPNCNVLFEWITLSVKTNTYEFVPAKEFRVNTQSNQIEEKLLREDIWEEQKSRGFAMHATVKPGTYAPAKPKKI